MIRSVIVAALTACALWPAIPAWAEDAMPTNITADTMMLEHAQQTAVFKGHVVLLRKDFQLYSDRLVVHYDPKAKTQLRKAEAYGHVKVDQGKIHGTSNEARYNEEKGSITLIGNAVLKQPGLTVHGERIVHDLRKKDTEVETPGGRVHLHLDGNGNAPAKNGKHPGGKAKP